MNQDENIVELVAAIAEQSDFDFLNTDDPHWKDCAPQIIRIVMKESPTEQERRLAVLMTKLMAVQLHQAQPIMSALDRRNEPDFGNIMAGAVIDTLRIHAKQFNDDDGFKPN